MSEYESAFMLSEHVNRIWSVIQYWTGVSFGLIAVSHLAGKHLGYGMTSILSILYFGFSFFVFSILGVNETISNGYIADLVALAEQRPLTTGVQYVLDTRPGIAETIAIRGAFVGTFFGALFFLWFSSIKNKRKGNKAKG